MLLIHSIKQRKLQLHGIDQHRLVTTHAECGHDQARGADSLPIAPHGAAKQAAIACHRSQTTTMIDDDPAGFRLTPDVLARFAGDTETFWELDP